MAVKFHRQITKNPQVLRTLTTIIHVDQREAAQFRFANSHECGATVLSPGGHGLSEPLQNSVDTRDRSMSRLFSKMSAGLLLSACLFTSTGCLGPGINLGPFAIPTPVSPYFQDKEELDFHNYKRYARVPILGPTTAGGPVIALDPPSDDEVIQALERARPVRGGIPLLHEKQRNNVRIVKEKIADYVDPPRFIPMIGMASLHHAHYKCTVYFSERTINGWPVPYTLDNEEAQEVLYIDHNHFHMCGNAELGATPSN